MQPLEGETQRWVVKWLRKADKDLKLAQDNVADPYHYDTVAYHCQQVAEKYVKAALVAHSIGYPYTHGLRTLLDALAAQVPIAEEQYQAAAFLHPFSTLTRYPTEDDLEPPAPRLLSLATQFRDWLRPALALAADAGPYPTR